MGNIGKCARTNQSDRGRHGSPSWAGASAGTCAAPPGGATTYSYDANGNTTAAGATTQSYNIFDQFTSNTSGGTTTNYTYSGPRNDVRLTAGGTSFLNGSLGITRQTTGGATTSFIRDPGGNLISMRTSSGASFYYTTDAIGSVILLTDSTQASAAAYSYDSWGNTTSSGAQAATNPWTYAGGYNDSTNNRIKFGARYYNPFRGRFTQADPSGREVNRYLYGAANPINNTDPSGLFCYSWNHDTPDCGWYGPPAPTTPWQCKLSVIWGSIGLFVPGAIWYAAAGLVVGIATSCF